MVDALEDKYSVSFGGYAMRGVQCVANLQIRRVIMDVILVWGGVMLPAYADLINRKSVMMVTSLPIYFLNAIYFSF